MLKVYFFIYVKVILYRYIIYIFFLFYISVSLRLNMQQGHVRAQDEVFPWQLLKGSINFRSHTPS